jgi:hypothetical protein
MQAEVIPAARKNITLSGPHTGRAYPKGYTGNPTLQDQDTDLRNGYEIKAAHSVDCSLDSLCPPQLRKSRAWTR